jgi:hypothetical protein
MTDRGGLMFLMVCGCALLVFLAGSWSALRAANVRGVAPNDPGRSMHGERGEVGPRLRELDGPEKQRAIRKRARQRRRTQR